MFGRMGSASGDRMGSIMMIFVLVWRRAAKNSNQDTWFDLDGTVDAIWSEDLTVLDNQEVLTLANGDGILRSK
jgi:dynein heavy chain, axonemal